MIYKHILVPVDGSEISATVVKQASALAKTFNAKLTIVQVMTIDPYIAAEYLAYGQSSQIIERARNFILENINKAKDAFSAEGVEAETRIFEGENIHHTIANVVKELDIDLVVMSSHGRSGIKKLFLGSVAQSLITELAIPVLVIKE